MKQKLSWLIVCLLTLNIAFGQYFEDKDINDRPRHFEERFETETWKTAYAVPRGQLHLSVFAPVRYGLLETVELQSHLALWAYLTPNLYVKKNWYAERWAISSKHGVYYPTIGLKRLKNDGENSTLNEDAEVPSIVTFQNELIVSYVINPSCIRENPLWIATGRLGTDISLTSERDISFNRMTFYSLFHRTASFYGDTVFYGGLQLDGGILQHFYFNIGADVYAVDKEFLAGIEAQANIVYHHNQNFSVSAGAKYIKTNNFIEKESHILPMIDICYRFGRKTWEKGLFRKR
ncbi:MAG: hypothetical protein KGV44_07620 [Flavobacteriaceae bacterium]|nr:hypothetical protein [Flavobacteriaceae bacterium]